jgi:heme-degrading monooxygenase HmoA
MFAVIFEVQPKPDHHGDYLALAAALRPELESIDGFITIERYASARRAGRVLSLSIWRDEKAVVRWRTRPRHFQAQARGRSEIFEDYHLRVGEIVSDNALPAGQRLVQQHFDETEVGTAKLVTISELWGGAAAADSAAEFGLPQIAGAGIVEHEDFSGIADPERRLLLVSWRDHAAAQIWRPTEFRAGLRHRAVRIIRDYGLRDRREAPQYHPPVV